jgi:hypothetical protein
VKTETYICDKCSTDITELDRFNVTLSLGGVYPAVRRNLHLCLKCCEEVGIRGPENTEESKSIGDKLEDLIYKIAEEAAEEGRS